MERGINKLGKRIAPGIWEDADGNLHFSVTEILELYDLPDTPENHEGAKQMLTELVKEMLPNAKLVYRQTLDDEGEDLR